MIRAYRDSDEQVLRALHEKQGFDYPFPDLKMFEGILVSTDEDDVPVQALAARKTAEIFMLGDPDWRTPAWRMAHFAPLHEEMHRVMKAHGYTDVHAWLPPEIGKQFGSRLKRSFGWGESKWKSYCKYL